VSVVRCPDCGANVALSPGMRPGDLVDCPNCAGHALRVRASGTGWTASLAHRVSCPACEAVIPLPESARAGDLHEHCGRRYRLTWAHGAFAAEPDEGPET
jgi:hypothetical protein